MHKHHAPRIPELVIKHFLMKIKIYWVTFSFRGNLLNIWDM